MNIHAVLQERFRPALASRVDDPTELLEMIRPSAQDAADYQANFAMPLKGVLGKSPRDIAGEIVGEVDVSDMFEPPEVAGPGFINLRLKTDWLRDQLQSAVADERLSIPPAADPLTIVIDYSSPNVAKPMHVGHIRSTVIGDAIYRILQFLGHNVISDNHVGDWGTQFGMIIYGYKNFLSAEAFETNPVGELSRLYKLVSQLEAYQEAVEKRPAEIAQIAQRKAAIATAEANAPADAKEAKKHKKALKKLQRTLVDCERKLLSAERKIKAVESSPELLALATEHASIHDRALAETARLHEGDEENVRLWNEFLPHCRDDMLRIYQRLGVTFDRELGESFYHDRLAGVIENLRAKGLAEDSEGAVCVFFGESETPMIVQKSDGAYLYSTTDLATIDYRMAEWNPDVILYVVDHRQHDHFAKLFKVARQLGHDVDLRHLAFGTVLGSDGTPYKTREGDAETLDSLLDEAVTRARSVVDQTQAGPTLSENEKQRVASVVGHAAVKYRDLSHNRESDYEFSYEKMLALTGDTAPYLQMGYSRVRSIFEKGGVDVDELRGSGAAIQLNEPAERQLGLQLRQFGEALERAVIDYRPNVLTEYVYALSTAYARFFESCHVLRAESEELKQSRLLLCDLTARTLRRGLELLGIEVLERM